MVRRAGSSGPGRRRDDQDKGPTRKSWGQGKTTENAPIVPNRDRPSSKAPPKWPFGKAPGTGAAAITMVVSLSGIFGHHGAAMSRPTTIESLGTDRSTVQVEPEHPGSPAIDPRDVTDAGFEH